MERNQEVVGLGELAQAVEGHGVALLGLAEQPAGVAGEGGDEAELDDPLPAEAEAVRGRQAPGQVVGHGHGDAGGRRRLQAHGEPAGEPERHHPAEHGEDER